MPRVPTACKHCRADKRRCIILEAGRPCEVCRKRSLICGLEGQPRQFNRRINPVPLSNTSDQLASPKSTSSRSSGTAPVTLAATRDLLDLPDQSIVNELVDLYFDLVHDKQHALFHPQTFLEQQRSGAAPMYLVLAMMAIVARFSSNPYFANIRPLERGRAWAAHSKRLFDERKEAVCLTAMQGCDLLCGLAFTEGDTALESVYSAMQIRMALLTNLPRRLSSDVVLRETEIRVWWTTWMRDTWSSASLCVPRQLTRLHEYPLPMEETAFMALRSGTENVTMETDARHGLDMPPREHGLWSQMIPLTEIFAQVNDLNNQSVRRGSSAADVLVRTAEVSAMLDAWYKCLPDHLLVTPANIERAKHKGVGRSFLALHFGYHHHSQLLYYPFLSHTSKNRAPSHDHLAHSYAARCGYHATQLSNLLWTANSTPGLECMWAVNGHLLVVASSIHLHTLLFSSDEQNVSMAKTMLERNFGLLLQMQQYWPILHLSMSRLRAFHRVCQMKMDTTFDMNKWMLRFLQEYALPVEDIFPERDGEETAATMLAHASFDHVSPSLLQGFSPGLLDDATGHDLLQLFL